MAFAYFILLASSLSAMQTFSVSALVAIYAVPLTLASGALTAYLLGNAGGILIGGILADNVGRHHFVAGGGMALAAAGALFIGHALATPLLLAPLMALVGFAKGVTGPSRDLLVRSATPPGASGKVFGFVYSGLDLGALAMPPVYGWLMDRGEPQAVFLVSAMLMIATILTVFEVRRQGAPAQART
jgi:FSR family fosmidomycin resistance protein-like MFS transporter